MSYATRCLLLAALSAILAGCSGIEFDVERDIAEQRVEGNVVSQVLGGVFENPIPMRVDVEAETEARDTGPACSVRLAALSLTVTETAGDDDFDFLESLVLEVESARADSTLRPVEVGRLDPVPRDATRLDVPMTGAELLPYVEEGARIRAKAEGSPPPDDVTFDGAYVVAIEAL